MAQTPLIKDFALFISTAYASPDSRPALKKIMGQDFAYERNKSSQLWAHYENKEMIIVAIHGANNVELNFASLFAFLAPSIEAQITKQFCKKYDELLNETKTVFLVGHSLGNFMIAACSLRSNKTIQSIMFAPYVPSFMGAINVHLGTNPKFKKLFYKQDFFANNLLRMGNRVKNALLFSNDSFIGNIKYRKNHAIKLFQQDINKDFKKRIG